MPWIKLGVHIPLPTILVMQTSRQIFIPQRMSHNVCHTMLITQYLTYCIFPSLCNTDCVTNKEQFGPTSSLPLAALASASAFCFSASAWCFILLFLECTELAALLVVSRTLKWKIDQNQLIITWAEKNPFSSGRMFWMQFLGRRTEVILYCFGGVILMQKIKFFVHTNHFLCVRSVVIEILVPKEFWGIHVLEFNKIDNKYRIISQNIP